MWKPRRRKRWIRRSPMRALASSLPMWAVNPRNTAVRCRWAQKQRIAKPVQVKTELAEPAQKQPEVVKTVQEEPIKANDPLDASWRTICLFLNSHGRSCRKAQDCCAGIRTACTDPGRTAAECHCAGAGTARRCIYPKQPGGENPPADDLRAAQNVIVNCAPASWTLAQVADRVPPACAGM